MKITVSIVINAPVSTVWQIFNGPEHNVVWNTGHESWHTPKSEIDLRVGGGFCHHMAAKDGSAAFDFKATFTEVVENQKLAYTMEDGRQAEVIFEETDGRTTLTEIFDAETQNTPELQQAGWQGILINLKNYVESL